MINKTPFSIANNVPCNSGNTSDRHKYSLALTWWKKIVTDGHATSRNQDLSPEVEERELGNDADSRLL